MQTKDDKINELLSRAKKYREDLSKPILTFEEIEEIMPELEEIFTKAKEEEMKKREKNKSKKEEK